MKRVLLSGYYGFGNVGDEAILEATVRALRQAQPDLEIAVLSADPQATAEAYGVAAAHRARPLSILRELRRCDLLLGGGGGLVQDLTSARSPLYYLGVVRLAQFLGRKTMVFAQGLGPVTRPRNVRLTRSAFRRAEAITVRDQPSAEWLRSIGITDPQPQVTADMAFLLEPAPAEEAEEVLARAQLSADQRLLGVSVRPWGQDRTYVAEVTRAIDAMCAETGLTPAFIPMHSALDTPLARRIAESLRRPAAILPTDSRPSRALALVGRVNLLLGMRLHSLIFAAMAGVPLVGLSHDPKVDALLEELQETPLKPVQQLCADEIAAAALAAWQEREARRVRLLERAAALRERAQANISAALACLSA